MKKSELKEMIRLAMLGEASQPKTKFDIAKMFGVDIEDIEDDNGNFIVTGDQAEMNAIARENGLNPEDVEHHSIRIYTESQLEEAKDEDEAEEVDVEEPEEEEEEINVEDEIEDEFEAAPEMSGDVAEVQDHLEAALEVAKAMGDEKLATQIKNTQIYLTRSQTVSEEEEMEESLASKIQRAHASEKEEEEKKEVSEEDLYENKRVLKIAGIIK